MNGHAGPSRPTNHNPERKKRVAEVLFAGEEDGELDINEKGMDHGEERNTIGELELDESQGEDNFPELDSGSEGEGDTHGIPGEQETDSEYEEDFGSESGYNTSDIEGRYGSSPFTSIPPSPSSSSNKFTTDEKLSRLISENTLKPDEAVGTDERISHAKEGNGRLARSRLVPGGYKREYEDVEAGYGSESSTEDVSCLMQ